MLFSTPVLAVEPIVGAFGLKLGDVWDGRATKTYEGYNWVSYDFIPDLPHDLFDEYQVDVTPFKKLIYWIKAIKLGECERQYQDLKKALIKKYGAGEGFGEFMHRWEQGKRKLSDPTASSYARTLGISCGTVELSIYYMDWDIYDSLTDVLPDTSNL